MKADSLFSVLIILITLLFQCCDRPVEGLPQPSSQRGADYSVTHLDIRDAILSLVSVLRDQMDKLERHEVRERQLGEQLTRSLSILEKRSRGEEKNMENMAQYIVRLDDKIKNMQTAQERQGQQRRQEQEETKQKIEEFATLLNQSRASGTSGGSGGDTSKLETKFDRFSDKLEDVSASVEKAQEKLDKVQEQIQESAAATAAAAATAVAAVIPTYSAIPSGNSTAMATHSSIELSESLTNELNEIKEALARTAEIESQLLSAKTAANDKNWHGEMVESMDGQRKQLAQLEEEIGKAVKFLSNMTASSGILQSVLHQLENETKRGFESLDLQVDVLRSNQTENLDEKLSKVQEILKSGQKHLEGKVKEAEFAIETLFTKMETGYDQMSKELKGLSNVESVLLDTGDSVLDTKRRLEYGVQQIMGEMNNQLTQHTSKLNDSLQQRFDGLANAVLGNQSIALTNLTSRMEEEISQVWRQIGILYHQVTRSADLLDNIHSQTTKYVNNSMDTMSSMDGKVGAITNRMGEVDDNLNYLLGRMSLVVQEFNMIKGGLGTALQSLRESLTEVTEYEKKPSEGTPGADETNEINKPSAQGSGSPPATEE